MNENIDNTDFDLSVFDDEYCVLFNNGVQKTFFNHLDEKNYAKTLPTLKRHPELLSELLRELPAMSAQFFSYLLSKRLNSLVKAMWLDERFAAYYSGFPIQITVENNEGNFEDQTLQLSMEETLKHFKSTLRGQSTEIIKAMWTNETLVTYLSGKETKILVKNGKGILEEQMHKLPLEELVIYFKAALASRCSAVIKAMWETQTLVSYFSGFPTEIKKIGLQAEILQLPTAELISHLKAALNSQCRDVVRTIWSNNTLSTYLSGEVTEILVSNEDGTLDKKIKQLSPGELISHFKAILAGRYPPVLYKLWGTANSPLQKALKTIHDHGELFKITEKVLGSDLFHINRFMKEFLSLIPTKKVLEECLEKRMASSTQKISGYKQKQIMALEDALAPHNLNSFFQTKRSWSMKVFDELDSVSSEDSDSNPFLFFKPRIKPSLESEEFHTSKRQKI